MGAQRLSAKTLRRVSRNTGLDDLKHGVAFGGYSYVVTTYGHRHYWYDLKTGEWGVWGGGPGERHFSSCPGGGTDDGIWSETCLP